MKTILAEINVSEGRDGAVLESIKKEIERAEVEIMDIEADETHNRTVFTFLGDKDEVLKAAKYLATKAVELIDMTRHHGEHPRMGAIDVAPFITTSTSTKEDALEVCHAFAKHLGELGVPVYYYEDAATCEERKSLVNIRKGEYEALEEKMKDESFRPDEGPFQFNPKSGATVTGVRFPLIAFNVNLRTSELEIGKKIVSAIRGAKGGYQHVRAMALLIEETGLVQISMNLTNYEKSPIHRVFETIKSEAMSYGVLIKDSELIGPIPAACLMDIAAHYVQAKKIKIEQIYK